MMTGTSIDGVLVQWGERLFYPASRIVKPDATPRLNTPNRPSAAGCRRTTTCVRPCSSAAHLADSRRSVPLGSSNSALPRPLMPRIRW